MMSSIKKDKKLYKCEQCKSVFTQKYNMLKHMRKFHKSDPHVLPSGQGALHSRIVCLMCAAQAPSMGSLRGHLQTAHNIEIVKKVMEFSTFEDFIVWKESYELNHNCRYSTKSSAKRLSSEVKHYYYCNEPCHVRSTASGDETVKRALCASTMEVSVARGRCVVNLWPVHVGHDRESMGEIIYCSEDESNSIVATKNSPVDQITEPKANRAVVRSRNRCRLCLSRAGVLNTLEHLQSEVGDFTEFLCDLIAIQIENDDIANWTICEECIRRVLDAHQLRKTALASDMYLRTSTEVIKEETAREDKQNIQQCSQCDKSFKHASELQRHLQSHASTFECSVCQKKFNFKCSLVRHMKQHARSGAVSCPHCRSKFRDHDLLKRHIAYAHQVKQHGCAECPAAFGSRSALAAHARGHAGRRLPCGLCDRRFALRHRLARHRDLHRGTGFQCDQCRYSFIQQHQLAAHKAAQHPSSKLQCAACFDTFTTRLALRAHVIKIHETVACSFCKQKFSSKYIKRHQSNCKLKIKTASDVITSSKLDPAVVSKSESRKKHAGVFDAHKLVEEVDKMMNDQIEKRSMNEYSKKIVNTNNNPLVYKSDISTKCAEINDTQVMIEEVASMMNDQMEKRSVDKSCKKILKIKHSNPELSGSELSTKCSELSDTIKTVAAVTISMNDQMEKSSVKSCKKTVINIEDTNVSCKDCRCEFIPSNPKQKNSITEVTSIALTDAEKTTKDVRQIESSNKGIDDAVPQVSNSKIEMVGSDCKGILGKCIVENNNVEDCICAKVRYEAPLPEYLTTPLLMALEQQGYNPY